MDHHRHYQRLRPGRLRQLSPRVGCCELDTEEEEKKGKQTRLHPVTLSMSPSNYLKSYYLCL